MIRLWLTLVLLFHKEAAQEDLGGRTCKDVLRTHRDLISTPLQSRYGKDIPEKIMYFDNVNNRMVFNGNAIPNLENPTGLSELGGRFTVSCWDNSHRVVLFYGCGNSTFSSEDTQIPLITQGSPTIERQWPWHVAIYRTQTVNHLYICGGTLISNKRVLTAAHCTTLKNFRPFRTIDPATLSVQLGQHNLVTSRRGVQNRYVESIIVHPEFESKILKHDLSILELVEPVVFTEWVYPACLWQDDQIDRDNVIGKEATVIGYGNDGSGELKQVKMPVVSQETCIRSKPTFFANATSDYTLCAGFRDGRSACNGDSGGGMFFKEGGFWYIRGVVSVTVSKIDELVCDPSKFVVFTDVAQYLPWIREMSNWEFPISTWNHNAFKCGNRTGKMNETLTAAGQPILEKNEWPWHAAIYKTKLVNFNYICSGTLVNRQSVITASRCVTSSAKSAKPVDTNSLTVYLGKHNLVMTRRDVQIRYVNSIIFHADFEPLKFKRAIAILLLDEEVVFTPRVSPVCLWIDDQKDLSYVVGKEGTMIGYDNDNTGELKSVQMPVVSQEACLRSKPDFFSNFVTNYTICAGYRDGRSGPLNGYGGGGLYFNIGGYWYFRGLATVSVTDEKTRKSDPHHYVVFTDIAQYLPWIRKNISQ